MKTMVTSSKAKIEPIELWKIQKNYGVTISKNSRGYWVFTSPNTEKESLAICDFNRFVYRGMKCT